MRGTWSCIPWLALASACAPPPAQEPPHLCFRPAAPIQLPGYTDSNSPAIWTGGQLRVFHGSSSDTYSQGPSLDALANGPLRQFVFPNGPTTRWLEATYRKPAPAQARLYGFYHSEAGRFDAVRCGAAGFDASLNLGVAEVGVMASDDDGLHWTDLGIVLRPPDSDRDCSALNADFASGNGDPDVAAVGDWIYLYYGNYGGPAATQGVSVARLNVSDLDAPVGNVWKWDGAAFSVPGLGGPSVALGEPFVARVPYGGKVDSLWGPSIHWNKTLKTWVMLLNRTLWTTPVYLQEGAYVSFNDHPEQPGAWSAPIKFSYDGGASFYPEFIGTATGDTDKRIGTSARYFEAGASAWSVEFVRGALPDGCQAVIP